MTKDEINEDLFQHLFHHQLTVLDYMTPDGMMKVIDAMGKKHLAACVMRAYSNGETQQHAALFTDGWRDGGKVYDDTLPEAVCHAAVAFLKEVENDARH